MTTRNRPKPPDSLGESGKAFWTAVVRVYDLAPAEVQLLRRAVRTVDLLDAIDVALLEDGPTVEGSMGQVRAHPLLQQKAEQERILDALIRGMALPFAGEDTGKRRTRAAAATAAERLRVAGV